MPGSTVEGTQPGISFLWEGESSRGRGDKGARLPTLPHLRLHARPELRNADKFRHGVQRVVGAREGLGVRRAPSTPRPLVSLSPPLGSGADKFLPSLSSHCMSELVGVGVKFRQ